MQANWQLPKKPMWIWRGVGDARQPLVPTALRPDRFERLKLLADLFSPTQFKELDERRKQAFLEFRIVERFLSIADRAGLSVPTLPSDLSDAFDDFGDDERQRQFEIILDNWPPKQLVPLIGLAQHYGLPTRLLDWTYDCLTAAYFAAVNAVRLRKGSAQQSHLAVWMASAHDLKAVRGKIDGENLRVAVLSPPRQHNADMMAQAGVFTSLMGPAATRLDVACRPLDSVVVELQSQGKLPDGHPGTFFAATLPWELAEELVIKLHNLGVSAAKLMPGFAGAAATMDVLADVRWEPKRPG